jgi:hypothetical protein
VEEELHGLHVGTNHVETRHYYLVVVGLSYKAALDGGQHSFTNPAETKALPHKQALSLVLRQNVHLCVSGKPRCLQLLVMSVIYVCREPLAITVSATDLNDSRLWVSAGTGANYGTCVDIWAPGYGILSAGNTADNATQ